MARNHGHDLFYFLRNLHILVSDYSAFSVFVQRLVCLFNIFSIIYLFNISSNIEAD